MERLFRRYPEAVARTFTRRATAARRMPRARAGTSIRLRSRTAIRTARRITRATFRTSRRTIREPLQVDAVVNGVTLGDGGANDIVGKAFIVHEKADDYKTQPSGNSGKRIACGVIE